MLEDFHLEGKDVRTIARDHGLSERAVEGRLRRARKALAKRLSVGGEIKHWIGLGGVGSDLSRAPLIPWM